MLCFGFDYDAPAQESVLRIPTALHESFCYGVAAHIIDRLKSLARSAPRLSSLLDDIYSLGSTTLELLQAHPSCSKHGSWRLFGEPEGRSRQLIRSDLRKDMSSLIGDGQWRARYYLGEIVDFTKQS